MEPGCVLTIAGSDPSGGAGIQADIKTFTNIGVYGCAVLTSVTVQNTSGVLESFHLPPELVRAQIGAVLEDIPISWIKTGMMGNAGIAEAVGECIDGYSVVCDPVLLSKNGFPLVEEKALDAVCENIIRRTSVLLPNIPELNVIAEMVGKKRADPEETGQELLGEFQNLKALLLKGGHWNKENPEITDVLLERSGNSIIRKEIRHPRISSGNTHGTGCTLSAAVTAYLAQGNTVSASVEKAVNYVHQLIRVSAEYKIGKGHGGLIHYLGEKQ